MGADITTAALGAVEGAIEAAKNTSGKVEEAAQPSSWPVLPGHERTAGFSAPTTLVSGSDATFVPYSVRRELEMWTGLHVRRVAQSFQP